jgi:DNA-directed RNA polymerase specialized sigma subunit
LESVLPNNMPSPEAMLNRKQVIGNVRNAIATFNDKLSPRDQDIFQSYIVAGESGPLVGKRHGISRQRVSQIGGKLKRQFKAHLIGNNIKPSYM